VYSRENLIDQFAERQYGGGAAAEREGSIMTKPGRGEMGRGGGAGFFYESSGFEVYDFGKEWKDTACDVL
jgi:hypothetical protein